MYSLIRTFANLLSASRAFLFLFRLHFVVVAMTYVQVLSANRTTFLQYEREREFALVKFKVIAPHFKIEVHGS